MDLRAVLNEIRSWPPEERLRLIEVVWDDLSDEGHPIEPSEALKELLDRRVEALEQNPDAIVAWEAVEARAMKRFHLPNLTIKSIYN